MQIQWPVAGSWALAACCGLALLAWYWVRASAKADADRAARRNKRMTYESTKALWSEAVRKGDIVRAAELKKSIDNMRLAGWHEIEFVLLVSLALLVCGCRTAPAPEKSVLIPTGEHVLLPHHGDVVPPLPEGEARWFLLTPTGLAFLLPSDSPILNTSTNAPGN